MKSIMIGERKNLKGPLKNCLLELHILVYRFLEAL